MTEHEHFEAQWRIWRHARLAELTHPFGWTSLTAQHWVREGDAPRTLEGLPGLWRVENGQVWITPEPSGDPRTALHIGGALITNETPAPPPVNPTASRSFPAALLSDGRFVEVLPRTTTGAAPAFAVRIRDPRAAATPQTLTLPAFDYNPMFRLDAVFAPHDPSDVVRETIVPGILDVVPSVGTLSFTLNGVAHTVVVFERETAGIRTPFTHVRDETSGSHSHSNGRMLTLAYTTPGANAIDVIDFNYLYSMPCAVTEHVSCPLPITENRLEVALLAGEQTPVRTFS